MSDLDEEIRKAKQSRSIFTALFVVVISWLLSVVLVDTFLLNLDASTVVQNHLIWFLVSLASWLVIDSHEIELNRLNIEKLKEFVNMWTNDKGDNSI